MNQDLRELKTDPLPNITAAPLEVTGNALNEQKERQK